MSPKHTEGVMRARLVAAVVIGVVVASVVSIVPAEAAHPVRSGTILVAARGSLLLGPGPRGCEGMPDCLAWLRACTQPPMVDVGASSSIVDVGRLARSSKTRTLKVVDRQAAWAGFSGVTIELWDRDCREVRPAPGERLNDISYARFRIPARVRWMTVTSGQSPWGVATFGGAALRWELR